MGAKKKGRTWTPYDQLKPDREIDQTESVKVVFFTELKKNLEAETRAKHERRASNGQKQKDKRTKGKQMGLG